MRCLGVQAASDVPPHRTVTSPLLASTHCAFSLHLLPTLHPFSGCYHAACHHPFAQASLPSVHACLHSRAIGRAPGSFASRRFTTWEPMGDLERAVRPTTGNAARANTIKSLSPRTLTTNREIAIPTPYVSGFTATFALYCPSRSVQVLSSCCAGAAISASALGFSPRKPGSKGVSTDCYRLPMEMLFIFMEIDSSCAGVAWDIIRKALYASHIVT